MTVRKRLRRWETAGFVFVCAAGTLLQFLYRWTGENTPVAAFASVNESTWEHMKILYLPYFVFTMLQFAAFAEPLRNYFAVKAAAGLAGTLLIPVVFYTVTGMFGEPEAWFNIALFYGAAAATYLLSDHLLRRGALRAPWMQGVGFALLWALALLFVYLTWHAPRLPLFRDPLTGGYGIPTPAGAP